MAQTLLHELAHAIGNARWGGTKETRIPFERRTFSEEGYDYESTIFDGMVVCTSGAHAFVTEWPAPGLVERYLRARQSDTGVTASLKTLTSADHNNTWRMPPCFVRAAFQKNFWENFVPTMGAEVFKTPRLLGVRGAPRGLGSMYSCGCESCFNLKEYVLRSCRRGNGALAPAGHYDEEVRKAEKKRKRNKRKHDRQRKDGPAPKEPGHLDCIRGEWKVWMGPKSPQDTRDIYTFGVPDGFCSLTDGSVVATEHMDDVAKYRVQVQVTSPNPQSQIEEFQEFARRLLAVNARRG